MTSLEYDPLRHQCQASRALALPPEWSMWVGPARGSRSAPVGADLNRQRWHDRKEDRAGRPATSGDPSWYSPDVAPLILSYLRDRPESLHRHPDGIEGKSFLWKDVSRWPTPDRVTTVTRLSESPAAKQRYVVCQDEATLFDLANLGCIELNPWNARLGSLDRPAYLVIDHDPEAIAFPRVIEAARRVYRVSDRAGVESLCRTPGRTELHTVVPLGARYVYEQARQFAKIVAIIVHAALPGSTSVFRTPARRQGCVYLDFFQNRRGQTLAAPYSVRPVAGVPVSTPLRWGEVRAGHDPARFTIRTIGKRVGKIGDVWAPVQGPGIDVEAALEWLGRHGESRSGDQRL
jgi:bifunctional non-homologous end joining protein LigD